MAILFKQGNLLDNTKAIILVNTVNCVGVMGKGVALDFKHKYPKMFEDYKRICLEGGLSPGGYMIWTTPQGRLVFNMATKDHWREPSKYAWVTEGICNLYLYVKLITKPEIVKIAMPLPGCGNGGLDPKRVGNLLRAVFGPEPKIFVTVYTK